MFSLSLSLSLPPPLLSPSFSQAALLQWRVSFFSLNTARVACFFKRRAGKPRAALFTSPFLLPCPLALSFSLARRLPHRRGRLCPFHLRPRRRLLGDAAREASRAVEGAGSPRRLGRLAAAALGHGHRALCRWASPLPRIAGRPAASFGPRWPYPPVSHLCLFCPPAHLSHPTHPDERDRASASSMDSDSDDSRRHRSKRRHKESKKSKKSKKAKHSKKAKKHSRRRRHSSESDDSASEAEERRVALPASDNNDDQWLEVAAGACLLLENWPGPGRHARRRTSRRSSIAPRHCPRPCPMRARASCPWPPRTAARQAGS